MKIQKLYALLHLQLYNLADFEMWLNWYLFYIKCDKIFIIDDNSLFNIIAICKNIKYKYNINKIQVINANYINPNKLVKNRQTYNYNWVINNIIYPNNNDIIIIPDIDEFWWYDTKIFKSFNEAANIVHDKIKSDSILIANILLANNKFIESRDISQNFNDISKYRCSMETCEHKPIIFYNGDNILSYHYGTKNNKIISNYKWDDNIGSTIIYDYPIRLYHYRLTTKEEYRIKIKADANYENFNNKQPYRYYASAEIDNFMSTTYKYDRGDLNFNILDLNVNKIYNTILSNNHIELMSHPKNYDDITVLTCNYNFSEMTMRMLESLFYKLDSDINVTIMDNSTINPINDTCKKLFNVIDNTNFKLTPNYNQVSCNHAAAIDYALKHCIKTKYVLLCDNDILFNETIKNFISLRHNYDAIGLISKDWCIGNRLYPYCCIIDVEKFNNEKLSYFDKKRCAIKINPNTHTNIVLDNIYYFTYAMNIFDTGASFYQDIKYTWNICNININDIIVHYTAGSHQKQIIDGMNFLKIKKKYTTFNDFINNNKDKIVLE